MLREKQPKSFSDSKWNTRKLVGFALLFLGSLLLCYTGKATGEQTFWFWAWLFGIYIVGNVGTKIATPTMINSLYNRRNQNIRVPRNNNNDNDNEPEEK